MLRSKTIAGLCLILAAAFILAACQQNTPVAPTLDANAIYTQAAATVAAGLAQTQSSQPSATPAPATATPTEMVTQSVDATLQQPGPGATSTTPEISATPGAGTPTVLALTPLATNTKSAPGASVPDKAEWVSQTPTDNTQIQVTSKFMVKYIFKNTGTTTWTTGYTFRYYAGEKLGSPNDLNLTKEVKPDQTVEIVFEATAPSTKGKTETIWVMTNAEGQNFYSVFMDLEFID